MYVKVIKRLFDILLSSLAIIILALPMVIIALIITIEDPGSPIFKQKRFGKDKSFFNILKFRSMKLSTPRDVPTHLMKNPEQYILKCGRFLRASSLDELPQLFNIFAGKMSFVGPRPALWNQEDLIDGREANGANSCVPGLTGLAQISGRDELELDEKIRIDGIYAKAMKKGGFTAFVMDLSCFFGTFKKVLKHEGVVEGGPDEKRRKENASAASAQPEDKTGKDNN